MSGGKQQVKDRHWDTLPGVRSRACTLKHPLSCQFRQKLFHQERLAELKLDLLEECSVMPGHETRRSKLYWFWQDHYLSNWLLLNGDWILFNLWCVSSSTWPKTEKAEGVPGTSQVTLSGVHQGKNFFSTVFHAEPPGLDTTPGASMCSVSHNDAWGIRCSHSFPFYTKTLTENDYLTQLCRRELDNSKRGSLAPLWSFSAITQVSIRVGWRWPVRTGLDVQSSHLLFLFGQSYLLFSKENVCRPLQLCLSCFTCTICPFPYSSQFLPI